MFIRYLLKLGGARKKVRQGFTLILRIIMGLSSVFIIADVLGYNSTFVNTVFGTVFGVGISWAIKDNVSNVINGLLFFVFPSFGVGDEVTVAGATGTIQSFHFQFVILRTTSGRKIYMPNSLLWNSIVTISYSSDPNQEEDSDDEQTNHNVYYNPEQIYL